MAGAWLVLVGTRAALFDVSGVVADVEREAGRWHTEEPPDPLPADGVRFHFYYLPTASAATLAAISHRRRVDAVIVGPEALPLSVRAPIKVRIGAGTNNVEVGPGEVCLNTPGVNADATAEWTFRALLWAYGGAAPEAISARTQRGELASASEAFEGLFNHELTGRVVALLGGGNIAAEVARLCVARHMRVRLWSSAGREGAVRGVELVSPDLDAVLDGAEIASVHVPLVADGPRRTAGLLDEARMRRLRRGAVLLNFARPQIVEAAALGRLMQEGHVAKAVVDGDLFVGAGGAESGPLAPFVALARAHGGALGARLLTLPHVGGDTSDEARVRGMRQAATAVRQALSGARLVNLVRPVPPPPALAGRAPPAAELPEHVGAVSAGAVRNALRGKAAAALREAAAVVAAHQDLGALDDATLRGLLRALRTVAEELPLDRRVEADGV